jgi:hypothetical protein
MMETERRPRSQAGDCLALRCGGKHRLVRQLPDDLAAMAETELSEQRAVRDDKLAQLFRRWPALSRLELGQLRRIYAERVRIARYVGRRRARD